MIFLENLVIIPFHQLYDLHSHGFSFKDAYGHHATLSFNQCNKYFQQQAKPYRIKDTDLTAPFWVGLHDHATDPPYFLFTAEKPVLVIFARPERILFPGKRGWFFALIRNISRTNENEADFSEFQSKIKVMGWRTFGLG